MGSETKWDVVISGTGLQHSLLALALSRSDKKVLHVDQNEYYGGAEAAFSLQDVDEWVEKVNKDFSNPFPKCLAVEDRCRAFERSKQAVILKSIYPHTLSTNHLHQVEAPEPARIVESLPPAGVSGSRELVDPRWRKWTHTEASTKWMRGYLSG